ncbi:MAG: transglutaminase family protein [Thermoanaerobaculia bacterium]|nr:transglutaminase family protein [Thermoanaerobaculia bacterium]
MQRTVPATLRPTSFLDFDHPAVAAFARQAGGAGSDRERAVRLYYAVRDGVRYDPYVFDLEPTTYPASRTLATRRSFCIPKAILLAAAARALGIPARLAFADVRNHLAPDKLLELMRTDIFAFHGMAELELDGRWIKATPAFDVGLCRRFGVAPLEFDGRSDSVLQPFDAEGRLHMEYVLDRGSFDDLPFAELVEATRERYPHLFDGRGRLVGWARDAAVTRAAS